ncbi:YraN family protein [Olivibacter sp. CPCC 100613]|uniref:YraN family protein n=1 Tax=Olivibacter sp. CPCC 100613 TaxID=3079931 RepID=UPI002FF64068
MATHQIIGSDGEQAALQYLLQQHHYLVKQNWRYKHLEVDLIMKDGSELVFVEVKTRSGGDFGLPYEAVNWQKQRKLSQAATIYIRQHRYEGEIRFDIVSIFVNKEKKYNIRHIKDAFWPRYS